METWSNGNVVQWKHDGDVVHARRLQPAVAGEMLFSRDGASLVDAALLSAPLGAAGDPPRRHLLLALLAAGRGVHGTCAAEPGAGPPAGLHVYLCTPLTPAHPCCSLGFRVVIVVVILVWDC